MRMRAPSGRPVIRNCTCAGLVVAQVAAEPGERARVVARIERLRDRGAQHAADRPPAAARSRPRSRLPPATARMTPPATMPRTPEPGRRRPSRAGRPSASGVDRASRRIASRRRRQRRQTRARAASTASSASASQHRPRPTRSGPKAIPTRNSTTGGMTASSPHLARSATLSDDDRDREHEQQRRHEQRLVGADRQGDGEQLLPAERDPRDQIERAPARSAARPTIASSGTASGTPDDQERRRIRRAISDPRRPAEPRAEDRDQRCRAAPRRRRARRSARSGRSARATPRRSRSPASTAARR